MADYVVRMTGQDNLSGTIKQVKSELNDLGKTTSKLDQIDAKFNKITQSAVGVKKEMRDLTALGSQLKFDGDYNAAQLLKIAKAAGEAKDSMDDFNAMKKYFADDNRHLNTAIQGMQGLAAAGSVMAGVLGMVGVEQEKVNQAILYCQSALSVLNGLNTIANVLNKDSYVRIALKVLGLKAEAAATNKATAAQAANTAATKAGTLAQLKLNAAVLANPYVLAAAAVVALGVAIYNLVKKSDELSEAQERAKKIAEEVQGVYEEGTKAYIKNSLELNQLRNSLDNFNGSKEEEKRLVEDLNNKYGNTLGKYKDLDSWKRTLADSSYYYCQLLKHEAILQAANAQAAEAYIKAISGEDVETNWGIYNTLVAEAEKQQKYVDWFRDQLNRTRRSNGDMSYSSSGSGKSSGSGRSTKTPKPKDNKNGDDVKGLIEEKEEEIKKLEEALNNAQTEEGIKNALKNLNDKKEEYRKWRIEVGLEDNPVEELEKEVQEALDNSDVKVEIPVSSFDLAMSKAKGERTDPLDNIKAQMDANDDLIASLKSYQQQMIEAKDTGTELYQELTDKIKELEEAQKGYGDTIAGVIRLQEKKEQKDKEEAQNLEKKKETVNAVGDSFAALGSIASSVGQMTDDKTLNAAAIIAQAIANYILGWSEATAKAAKAGPLGWVAFGLASLAQVVAVVAQIHSLSGYASGGIISGGSSYGDQILARVNAGEMVLNRKQQSNLFRAIESGNIGAGQTVLVPEFKIKGSDLYGTLRNFSKSVGKTGKVTGIR